MSYWARWTLTVVGASAAGLEYASMLSALGTRVTVVDKRADVLTVADRDDSATAAEQLGATVLSTNDTDWTRDAQIRDPQGAVFTVSQYSPPSG